MGWPIKRNDLLPAYRGKLLVNGQPVDLTGRTVRFILNNSAGVLKVAAAASIVGDPTLGEVEYEWVAGDTNTAGTFKAEWEVDEGGRTRTFPSRGYLHIEILEDLADT